MSVALLIIATIVIFFYGVLDQMENKNKNILIVDQNPELLSRFSSAFLHSGYRVQTADRIADAFDMVSSGNRSASPFDLVIVDISNEQHLGFVADVQNINSNIPVFTLKAAEDKSFIIDLLNQKRTEIIEQFIESHAKV
jgi:DNA-binding response OmpR family regulator